jgi:hypothetical protein
LGYLLPIVVVIRELIGTLRGVAEA